MLRILLLTFVLAASESVFAAEPVSVLRGVDPSSEAPHGNGNVYGADIVCRGDGAFMFYGGQGRDGHDRILLATSSDHKAWKPIGVVFAPDGVNHVNDPSVVIVDDKFYMYYTRANAGVTDTIGLATSANGRQWEDHGPVLSPREKPAWDSLLVGRPSVINDGTRFHMWFDGRADLPIGAPDEAAPKSATSQRYVGYAESTDGISWKRHGDFVFANDAGGVHVSLTNEQYIMVIESRQGTKWATSNDGRAWQDRGLLVEKDKRTAVHGHVTPFLFAGRHGHMLYFGVAQTEHWNQNSIMRVAITLPPNETER